MIQNKIIQSEPSKGIYLQIRPFTFVLAPFLEMTKFQLKTYYTACALNLNTEKGNEF